VADSLNNFISDDVICENLNEEVWVELDEHGRPIRIFRDEKAAMAAIFARGNPGEKFYTKRDRSEAVREIRRQVYARQQGRCLYCPKLITWAGMHLHEKQHRGQGGEISLENSVGLCYDCHINQEHGNRKPRFGK
jgi:hypothetical protein